VQLYAFDVLALGGDDLRSLPLHLRKQNLAQLLARRPDGITRCSSAARLGRTCSGQHVGWG
jgi:ATP-dependent DNA ligase